MRKIFDEEAVNLFWLSCVSLLVAFQLLAVIVLVFQRVPLASELTSTFFPDWVSGVRPEREPLFYQILVILVVGLQAGLVYKFRGRLQSRDWSDSLLKFLGMEIVLTSLLGFVAFKLVVEGESVGMRVLLYSSLAMACLSKLFWKQTLWFWEMSHAPWPAKAISPGGQTATRPVPLGQDSDELRAGHIQKPAPLSACHKIGMVTFDFFIFVLIVFAVFIPDREGVIAQIFGQDMFHHFDTFVASPAWAWGKGNIFNVDSYSQYGFGMPMVAATMSRLIGGVSYENILLVFLGLSIVYLILSYTFLRLWFKNIAVAFLGLLLILKFQMFNNSSADPITWRYPSTTVVRYFFDIPFFILILLHLRKLSTAYLILAGVLCGVAVFYLTDSGVYLTMTYYGYLFLLLTLPAIRRIYFSKNPCLVSCGYFILPLVSAVFLFGVFVGYHLLTAGFWNNLMDFVRLFKGGWGALPINSFASEGKFLNFFMGAGMCFVYLFTVIFVGVMCWREKWGAENLLAGVIAIYGLGIFHYYIARSSPDSIPVVCIPCLLLFCFWLNIVRGHLSHPQWKYAVLVLGVWGIVGLWTTRAFIQYPNCLSLPGKSFAAEKQKRNEQSPADRDIDLIRRLTEPDQKVCLVSSLETAILMKADRRPFLYYFPLLFSRTFHLRDFGGTTLFTRGRLKKTMDDLETKKPRYVFIEKKFLGGLPQIYYARFEVLKMIVMYFQEKYEPAEVGEYLVALRRKD